MFTSSQRLGNLFERIANMSVMPGTRTEVGICCSLSMGLSELLTRSALYPYRELTSSGNHCAGTECEVM